MAVNFYKDRNNYLVIMQFWTMNNLKTVRVIWLNYQDFS